MDDLQHSGRLHDLQVHLNISVESLQAMIEQGKMSPWSAAPSAQGRTFDRECAECT